MWIKELQTDNFRNLVDGQVQFEPGLNWLYGPNGHGKTNCLESAYLSLTGKSFRTPSARDLLRVDGKECSLVSKVVKGTTTWEYGVRLGKGKTTRLLGGKVCKSLDFFKSASIMAFTARAKNMVDGVPDDRRRFIDRMIACTEPQYMILLSKYRKIMSQLRPVLLQRGDLGVYRGFKAILAPVSRAIVDRRMGFIDQIKDEAGAIFTDVFQGQGKLRLAYKIRNVPKLEFYEKHLLDICAQEMLHRKSLSGPHLDDLEIVVEDHAARHFASSGQVRAIVLATKLAVREVYFRKFGYYPVLLLDDIDAELDPVRLGGLLSFLSKRGQCLISTSKYGTIGAHLEGCVYVVEAGRISPKEG